MQKPDPTDVRPDGATLAAIAKPAAPAMTGELHALALDTRTPEEG